MDSLNLEESARFRQVLGIRFFAGTASAAAALGSRGGLVVVPAAPALIEIVHDQAYREALLAADLVLTDSAFMVLLWNRLTGDRLPRVSGLEYLRLLLAQTGFDAPGNVLWIMPTAAARERNLAWLARNGLRFTAADTYVAPVYQRDRVEDAGLAARIAQERPKQIVVGLGGGVQEKLGHYLREHCGYHPAIHCIGAAIGFLSGDQVGIPDWADRWFLGWAFRCASDPRRFVPRYFRALRLAPLMFRYRDQLPQVL